jgi:hypothetical protein
MKNNKVHQSFVCHTVPSRLSRTNRSFPILTFIAVFAGCLLAGTVGQAAPVNLLKFPLTNAPGTTVMPSDTSLGGVNVNLTMYNGAGTVTNFSGLVGSGVNGVSTGDRAMCLTNKQTGNATQSANANGAANSAADLGDATLAFGTITNFVITMWINEPIVYSDATGNTLPRLFVLGNGGSPGANDTTANTIGVKFQVGNQFELSINAAAASTGNSYNAPANTATLGTTLASDLQANKWYFVAWVYDGTNIYQFTGADSAVATLQNQFAAGGLSVNLGNPSTLLVGNRNWKGTRGYFGSMEDFRFYTGTSTNNLNFVESIRKEIAPKLPTITGIYPDGASLLQNTNKLVFTAQSSSGLNLTNISLVLNNVNKSASLQFVTNGTPGTATNVSASYTGLLPQTLYTAVISAADPLVAGSVTVNFDTFNPTNFIVKAEEFDYNSGLFIDNPVYNNAADPNSYFGLDSVEGVDTHKGQTTGDNQATDYRFDDGTGLKTQTPLAAAELPSPTRFGSNNVPNHMIGNWSSAEWQNYTKTFPAGNYNVYARLTTSSGSTVTFDKVTSGQGTPRASQTLANLGQFTFTGSGTFQWVPLLKNGTLAVVNLSGQNTVSTTTGGGANADFYMLVPANPNLPSISNVYPDGQFLFEPTNKLVFTVSSSAGINTANITLTLNGTNVSAGLVFSGGPNTWNVSYTGLQNNQTYATVISVTDSNAASANATLNIDTWNPVLQVEAEDFDFNPAKSIVPDLTGFRYIDNPVPTPPLVPATNSYEGQVGDTFLDEQGNNLNNGLSPIQNAYAGATLSNYRTNDPCATAPVTDTARRQFQGTGALDYNVGFLGAGHWEQYTRTWPSGTYNLYARVASGANLGTLYSSWSQVITGWGTTNQTTRHIGSFAIPSTGGYSSYFYTPLIDAFGNYVQLTGGTNTFRDTHLVFNQTETANAAVFGLNINFYMLLNARTDLARIDNVYPDGSLPMQITNTLSFVASSPTYGINTTNIHMTLNGVNISSNLVFSGSSGSWNVSYPGLQPGSTYTAVITVTDNNNQSHTTTVNFDTFNPNNFTWEAEDFDFGPENSPDPNGSTNRYIDNPAPTHSPATNSYFGQVSDLGIDVATIFGDTHFGTYLYRSGDWVATEVTSDGLRSKYVAARQLDPTIVDYDLYTWTNNAFINYTRTYPAGNFHVFARASGGNGAFKIQCAQVTGGWGTTTQTNQYLGTFNGTGANFNTWQYVPLVNTNTGLPVTLSLGGTNTFQMAADGQEHVNYFMLEGANPVTLTASISGTNILLSFPTQTGFNYSLSYKNNLTDPSWTPLGGSVAGNGMIQTMTDGISQTNRFYRLTIQ